MSTIYSVDVQVTAPVNDTEVTERVVDAVRNLFPTAEIDRGHGEIVATTHDLEALSEALHRQEILDSARGAFFENHRGDSFSFEVKKQPAFEGVVNFAVGEPSELGDLHVRVTVDEPDVESYIDHIAPPTEDGQPVDPEE